MFLDALKIITAEALAQKPVALMPPSVTIGEAKLLMDQERLAGLVIGADNGEISGACTATNLTNLPDATQTIGSLIGSIEQYKRFGIINPTMPLADIVQNITLTSTNCLILQDNVQEGSGLIKGLIEPALLILWLWQQLNLISSRLGTVLDTVNDAITIIDEHNVVVAWNRQAEKLYKIPTQQICGKPIDAFFTDLVVTKVMKENREVRNDYHQPCTGTHVLINSKPIYIDRDLVGSVSSERDITEIVNLHQDLTRANSQVRMLEQRIQTINGHHNTFGRIIGHSKNLSETISLARRVATTNAAVLIRGESGTGKELFAEAIHQESQRKNKALIAINCGAIPHTLFESELFGYRSGAFTGADRKGKPGKFDLANGGTIFLDEIGELHLDMQVKLLRVLQQNVFYPVGGNEAVTVDVRVIASTNRDLEKLIDQGLFREDLYYRLNVVALEVPPLRERKEDIPELTYAFIQEFSGLHHRKIDSVEPEVLTAFFSYHWPGNVRELRNLVERLVVLTEGDAIKVDYLPSIIKVLSGRPKIKPATSLPELTRQSERDLIIKTLEQHKGNKALAARKLGIPRSTLYYKLKSLGLD